MNLVTRDKIDAFQWLASGIRYLHMLALVLSKKIHNGASPKLPRTGPYHLYSAVQLLCHNLQYVNTCINLSRLHEYNITGNHDLLS